MGVGVGRGAGIDNKERKKEEEKKKEKKKERKREKRCSNWHIATERLQTLKRCFHRTTWITACAAAEGLNRQLIPA